MRIPGAPPRPAKILLRELDTLIAEIEELAVKDPIFGRFFYSPQRCPIRVLGFRAVHQPLTKTCDEWDNR